jgi:hypothetical protein
MIALTWLPMVFALVGAEPNVFVPPQAVVEHRSDTTQTLCTNTTGVGQSLAIVDDEVHPSFTSCSGGANDFRCSVDGGFVACSSRPLSRPGAGGLRETPDVYVAGLAAESLSPESAAFVESLYVAEMLRVSGLRITTTHDLHRALDEAALAQARGCLDPACLPDIAAKLGARHTVSANAALVNGTLSIALSLIDVRAGQAIAHESLAVRSYETLTDALAVVIHNLFSGLKAEAKREVPVDTAMRAVDDTATVSSVVGVSALVTGLVGAAALIETGAGVALYAALGADRPIWVVLGAVAASLPILVAAPIVVGGSVALLVAALEYLLVDDIVFEHGRLAALSATVVVGPAVLAGLVGGIGLAAFGLSFVIIANGEATESGLSTMSYAVWGVPAMILGMGLSTVAASVIAGACAGAGVLASVSVSTSASDFDE